MGMGCQTSSVRQPNGPEFTGSNQYSVMAERNSARHGYKTTRQYAIRVKDLMGNFNNLKFSETNSPRSVVSTIDGSAKAAPQRKPSSFRVVGRLVKACQAWRTRARKRSEMVNNASLV